MAGSTSYDQIILRSYEALETKPLNGSWTSLSTCSSGLALINYWVPFTLLSGRSNIKMCKVGSRRTLLMKTDYGRLRDCLTLFPCLLTRAGWTNTAGLHFPEKHERHNAIIINIGYFAGIPFTDMEYTSYAYKQTRRASHNTAEIMDPIHPVLISSLIISPCNDYTSTIPLRMHV